MPANMCGQMSGSTDVHAIAARPGLAAFQRRRRRDPGDQATLCRSDDRRNASGSPSGRWRMESAQTIKNYLREELKKVLPERPVESVRRVTAERLVAEFVTNLSPTSAGIRITEHGSSTPI